MTSAIPSFDGRNWHPSTYWDQLKAEGKMPEPSDSPTRTDVEDVHGEVPPDLVFTAGMPVAPPKHRPAVAGSTFRGLMGRLGPGAADQVERELARAAAFEVIARAAVALVDNAHDPDREAWVGLLEAVAENRAAIA